jgi:hypothetical protein
VEKERVPGNAYAEVQRVMVKKFGGKKLWKRHKAEKSNTDFPALFGNPANYAGFPLSHSFGCCYCLHGEQLPNRRGHF